VVPAEPSCSPIPISGEEEPVHARLWNPDPDDVGEPGSPPDRAPAGQEDHTSEVMLKDHQGRLRLPAYVLIALVVALATVLLLTVVMLFASR
jgi:hypothetical protein